MPRPATPRLLVACALLLASSRAAPAGMVVGRPSLDELTRDAGAIVHATVGQVRSGRDGAGLPATWVRLHVHRSVKGRGGESLVIKQFGVAAPLADGTVLRISGLPRWRAGEEVVLFLRAESAVGFTSPVGLMEGVFAVERSAGRPRVTRHRGGGSQELDAFLEEVERLARRAP